jgi:nucleoside-diphosphate-sugar epimerase
MATQHLLEAAKDWPGRFVFASSSSVYGHAADLPTHESTVTRPVSPYGQTKLSAEHLCWVYESNYGVDVTALRYFTVFGPRQRPDMAMHRFCRAAILGESLVVFDDGTQTRDFTFVADIVAATRAAATAPSVPAGSVFNVGGGSPATIRQCLDLIAALADRDLDVVYADSERGDVRHTAADTSRARELMGYSPTTTLEQGLAAEFAWVEDLVSATSATGNPS